jgi:protoporphyrinogen oxidase
VHDPGRILILGAGPTGLGAASRLEELGHTEYRVLDRVDRPGGLARSFVDSHGFTWDIGGHVQFSHYWRYDELCDRALGDAWLHHERESWVWIRGRFVPYPFQNNIHRLDPVDRDRALAGVERAAAAPHAPPANFREWIAATFGEDLAEIFFYPYNRKVWGYPLDMLGVSWMGERVAVPDIERLRRNVRENRDDVSWGPNNRFRFPLHGGTGAIWGGVAKLLPRERLSYNAEVVSIAPSERVLMLRDGRRLSWDVLISTMPLDLLCPLVDGLAPAVRRAAASLVHSAVHILGIGIRGPKPETLARKCWMYFPEAHSPYYRVTVFSNYSPNHVPPGDGHWSLMAEVCESVYRRVHRATLAKDTIEALRRDGLLPAAAQVVSSWHLREGHGYPTPSLGRDEALATVHAALEPLGIYSRGRFGAWKYEVSNQDHSCMQGMELVDRLLGVGEGDEPTLNRPSFVNGGAFARRPEDA